MTRFVRPIGLAALLLAGPAFGQSGIIGQNFLVTTNSQGNALGSPTLSPPDTVGSVGPNHFVQFVNGQVSIFTKSGGVVSRATERNWWRSVSGTGMSTVTPAGDPRVLYDPSSQRWFAVAFTGQDPNNTILFARSNTADPTGAWAGGILPGTAGLFNDFPTLGVDANGVYVGTNNYLGNSLQNVSVFAVPKGDLLAATPTLANTNRFDGIDPNPPGTGLGFAVHGQSNFSSTAGSSGLIAISNTAFGAFRVTPVTWVGNSATLGTTVNVPLSAPGNYPPDAPQPGTGTLVSTGDDRLNSFAWRIGNLIYGVHGNSVSSRAAARWFVIDATTNTRVADGNISDPTRYYYHPSIAANPRGDIVIGFTGSSGGEFPSVYAVVGTPNTPFSPTSWTFGTPFLVQAGEVSYSDTGNPTRWGDYSATTLDPADPGIFWTTVTRTANQSSATHRWGSQVTEIVPPVPGEVRWQTAAAGDASVASNWFGGAAPATTDHAIFSRWSTTSYAVTIPSAPPIGYDRLSVRQTGTGTLTFALGTGASLTLANVSSATPSLAVSEFQGQSTAVFTGGIVSAQNVIIGGQAGGSGVLRVENGATLTVAGDIHVGGTSSAPGGTGTLSVDGSSAAAAVTVAGNLKLWQTESQATVTSATLTAGGLTHGTGSPILNLTNAAAVLFLNGSGSATFGGVIAGPGVVTKSGSGAQTFAGANTYSGNTSVSQGTLALAGSGSFAGSPVVTVVAGATLDGSAVSGGANHDGSRFALASGQTLNGTGTVAGGLGVRPGSVLAPGTSPGKLTVTGGLVFTGGTLGIAITGPTPGTEHSQVEVTSGAIDLGLGVATLSLPAPTGAFAPTSEIVIISGSGSAAFTGGEFAGLPNGAAVPALAGLGGQSAWYISYGVEQGSGLSVGNDVLFTPVPEPGTGLFLALGCFAARRWRGISRRAR